MAIELNSGTVPKAEATAPDPPKRRGRPPGSKNRAKSTINATEISEKLTEAIGIPVAFISPIAAAVLEQRKERTSVALVRIAEKYPAFGKYLKAALDGSAFLDVGMTIVGMGIGIGVDLRQLEYDSMIACLFGIDDIVMELYPPEESPQQNGSVSPEISRRGLFDA